MWALRLLEDLASFDHLPGSLMLKPLKPLKYDNYYSVKNCFCSCNTERVLTAVAVPAAVAAWLATGGERPKPKQWDHFFVK
jgi:hypothetical protein